MGKKGKGGGKQAKEDKDTLPEVDKEFYEIQITDLNQKLTRMHTLCGELETDNDEMKRKFQKLDEDRADIIAYLKCNLHAKSDQISDLEERLCALQQVRESENCAFIERIKNMEHEFKVMHEQLTSEIKLLNGKLNSLEEFRSQREELTNKFAVQEVAIEEQEKRHKNTIYEIEKKFIVGKDELEKEMESRLIQLSLDFQKTIHIQIAATTQRVIRENVAINNELNIMLMSWKKYHNENISMKKQVESMRHELESSNEDMKKLTEKNKKQLKIIVTLTKKYSELKTAYKEMENLTKNCEIFRKKFEFSENQLKEAKNNNQIQQTIIEKQEAAIHENETELMKLKHYISHLEQVIDTTIESVKDALGVHVVDGSDDSFQLKQGDSLSKSLLEIFSNLEISRNSEPGRLTRKLETKKDLVDEAAYQTGDLGLMSKHLIKTLTFAEK